MKVRQVVYRRAANADLQRLGRWLAFQVSPSFSKTYLGRIRKRIDTLAYSSERGTVREEAGAGVRVIGIMGPISVAFVVTDTRVVVLRILYRGQDWQSALTTEAEN